jgi:hypothetical protein
MTKTFTYAGVSTLNGVCKFRVANDSTRVKVLAFNGHKDIDIIELKEALTKEDAVAFLLSINFDNGNAVVRATLEAAAEKTVPVAVKEPRAPKAPRAPKEPRELKSPKAPKAVTVETVTIAAKPKAKAGPTIEAIKARAAAKVAADAAKLVVDDADDAPY